MAKKYKWSLFFLGLCLIFSIFLLFSYQKYRKYLEATSPLVLVQDGLSINFTKGNTIENLEEKSTYTFSITNNDTKEISYTIFLENVEATDTVKYDLIEKKSVVNSLQNEITKEDSVLANSVKIKPNETHFYTLIIYDHENLFFRSQLKILKEESNNYFANRIKEDNSIKKEKSKVGKEEATDNEGLIESIDNSGTFYYFRGKIDNNFVSFANLTWRIVKINSDGSIKLILDDYAKATGNFYENKKEISVLEKVDFSNNKMHDLLTEWYQNNLKNFEENIISHKYCVDDSITKEEEEKKYYAGSFRLLEDYSVTNKCLGTNYTSKIGLLSADEVALAGATSLKNNTEFYLYLPDKLVSWWTLTPGYNDGENIVYFEVDKNGKIVANNYGEYYRGIRPVIHLIKKTEVTGKGTKENPYVVQ